DLVREPRPHRDDYPGSDPRGFAPSYLVETHGSWQQIDGYTDSPDRGTSARGQQFLELGIQAVADAMSDFAARGQPPPGQDRQL
ncbi:MAG: hypothetical protein ACRDNZ_14295, partial [Streptosporangiaceae bacterium]